MAKAKKNKYNVYDNGKLILQNVTSGEIEKVLGCKTICISNYAEREMKYKDRYTFEVTGTEDKAENDFITEWNRTVRLFRNVVWVKNGGRKLCVAKH